MLEPMSSSPPYRSPSPIFEDPPSRNSSISSATSGCEPKVAKQLPRLLPRPQHYPEEHSSLKLEVDNALLGVPLPFVRNALTKLGPALFASSNQTRAILPLGLDHLPPRLASQPPPPHLPVPTHLLALSFRDQPSYQILLPTHGLPLALASPLLAFLSAPDTFCATDDTCSLPVVHLTMPSVSTFFILHDYLLLGNLDLLFHTLRDQLGAESTAADAYAVAPRKAATLHGLWRNIVALELQDDSLWERLQREWAETLAELPAEV